jgi:hypothetical protein
VFEHAKELATTSHLQAVLVHGNALKKYAEKGTTTLLDYFHQVAQETLKLKNSQMVDGEDTEQE